MYELKKHRHSRKVPVRPPWTAMEIAGNIVILHTIATKNLLEFLVKFQVTNYFNTLENQYQAIIS